MPAVQTLSGLGFKVIATGGTADYLADQGIAIEKVNKVQQGRPHIVDRFKGGGVDLIVNTTEGCQSLQDSASIRGSALAGKVPYFTTASASIAAAQAIAALGQRPLEVRALQTYYQSSVRA